MPANFTFGPLVPAASGLDNVAQVNLIDFGAGRRIGQDRRAPTACHPAFSSVRMSLGFRKHDLFRVDSKREDPLKLNNSVPEERDDLESLAYTLIYLATDTLPWLEYEYTMSAVKCRTTPEEFCKALPPIFAQFLLYARELEADVKPDYDRFMLAFGELGRLSK